MRFDKIFLFYTLVVILSIFRVHPALAQVFPGAGAIIQPGADTVIQWDTTVFFWGDPSVTAGNVSITLWNSSVGNWTIIDSSIPLIAGSFTWSVPASLSGTYFLIEISSLVANGEYLISDSYFTIQKTENLDTIPYKFSGQAIVLYPQNGATNVSEAPGLLFV